MWVGDIDKIVISKKVVWDGELFWVLGRSVRLGGREDGDE